MTYEFDTVIDRKNTMSLKYDFAKERNRPEDVLPLWVADMDFQTAPGVSQALERVARHGIFGYSEGKKAYFDAVSGWYERRFHWSIEPDWIIKTPGVVFALAAAIRAFTREGDAVLIQQPVYYPFSEVILDNHRRLINNSLRQTPGREDGRYEMDFADFEAKIRDNQVRLFLLCSPHNPVGRVWEEWELRRIGEICLRYGVTVVSDEIHSDFVYSGHRHLVFADLDPRFAANSVTCTSPGKTFNLAGLQISNIMIPNPRLREAFARAVAAAGYSQVGVMGLAACQAAYETGEEWLIQLKDYLEANRDFVRDYLKRELPQLRMTEPEGTYLLWLDFRGLGLTEPEREELLLKRAKLWLDSGAMFGPDGEGFERMNIACPRVILTRALDQLREAVWHLPQP